MLNIVEGRGEVMGPVIKCFCFTSQLKNKKQTAKKSFSWPQLSLPRFQGARPGHVLVESKVQVVVSLGS